MDRRYVCESCGVKWVVTAQQPASQDPCACQSCGGKLVALLPVRTRPWQLDGSP